MALTTPFAQNGDKKAIPQTTSDGSVSFDRGFGSFYALPPEEGGLFIDRAQFNQLMFDTTSQVLENKQQITAQANRINEVNTTLTQSINTKANQATTYTKTEVNNLLNAKANANATVNLTGNQTIAGIKTFRSPVVVPNATANTHAVNLSQLNTKANANATVNLTGNQTIQGVKTFSSPPVSATNPTANNQVANKAYVDSKSRKVSWGLNWNAGITVNGHTPLVIPNDGVIFLWGGEEFLNIGHPNDTKISAFQFTPKNYTARSGIYSKLFSKSVANGRETITEDPTENSFFLFGLGSGIFTGSPTIYPLTTTLSFLPVRQGDKVFLQYFNRFGRDYYYLFGIFFPFEK